MSRRPTPCAPRRLTGVANRDPLPCPGAAAARPRRLTGATKRDLLLRHGRCC